MSLPHCFKALAERTTADVRDELGLKLNDRLDSLNLAAHQGIPGRRELPRFDQRCRVGMPGCVCASALNGCPPPGTLAPEGARPRSRSEWQR